MNAARNFAIVALVALAVTVLPGGGTATDTVLAALNMVFLAVIAWAVYRFHQENEFAISTLSDGWRTVLYGALGLIALLIAGMDELWSTGGGTLSWILLMVVAFVLLANVVREASSSGY